MLHVAGGEPGWRATFTAAADISAVMMTGQHQLSLVRFTGPYQLGLRRSVLHRGAIRTATARPRRAHAQSNAKSRRNDAFTSLRHDAPPWPAIVVNVPVVGVKGHGRYAVDHRPTLDTHHRNAQSGQYEEGAAKTTGNADGSLAMTTAGTPPIRKCRYPIHAREQGQHSQQDMHRRYPINGLGDDESTGHRDGHLRRRRRDQTTGVLLRRVRLYDVHQVPFRVSRQRGTVELIDTTHALPGVLIRVSVSFLLCPTIRHVRPLESHSEGQPCHVQEKPRATPKYFDLTPSRRCGPPESR